jgi:iron(III) transport system substrate-binding protein
MRRATSGLFRPLHLAVALAGILTLVSAHAPAQNAPSAADIANYQGADRGEKLAAEAKKEGTVSIYTSATVKDMAALTAAFEKKYGIKVQVWRASGESLVQRAVVEARGNRFDVDVIETDGPVLESLYREKLLRVVKSPSLPDLIPVAIPPHGEWLPDRVQIFTAAYNTDQVRSSVLPKSYEDLADPRWKGKLGIEADDGDWFAAVIGSLGEDKGLALFRKIVSTNGISVRKGHTLLTNLVVSGEVPLTLTAYLYKVQQLKAEGAPIEALALAPEIARAQGVAVARRAPHPNAAVLFMDFMLSDGQTIMANRDFFPTNTKVKPLPAGLDLKFADPAKILDEADKWDKLYQEIIINQSR